MLGVALIDGDVFTTFFSGAVIGIVESVFVCKQLEEDHVGLSRGLKWVKKWPMQISAYSYHDRFPPWWVANLHYK